MMKGRGKGRFEYISLNLRRGCGDAWQTRDLTMARDVVGEAYLGSGAADVRIVDRSESNFTRAMTTTTTMTAR